MDNSKLVRIPLNDMEAVYRISEEGEVSFTLVPEDKQPLFLEKGRVDPLVQISVTGDATSIGFEAGETRHNSTLTMSMKYASQDIAENGTEKIITTVVKSEAGLRAEHIVVSSVSDRAVRVFTKVYNDTDEPVTTEAISSVNLSGITP